MNFAQEVWDTLSQIDISAHTEQMSGPRGMTVTYLPWHKAWLMVKRLYPASTYHHEPDIIHADGTMEVGVHVTIDSGSRSDPIEYVNGVFKLEDSPEVHCYARLGVMDSKFNAIPNPDARAINDGRQRALVKALAFAGLGLSLWDAGSQTPVGMLDKPISQKQAHDLAKLIDQSGSDLDQFLKWAGIEKVADLPLERLESVTRLLNSKLTKQGASK